MRPLLTTLFNTYSEIFFLRSPAAGLAIFALTLLNPNLSAAGIMAVIAAYLFARFIGMGKDFLNSGFYTYNALLVGLSLGYLFRITPLTVFFVVIAGISTVVLTVMLNNIFSYYFKLPILSLPFTIISSTAYLAASQYSNLYVTGLYPQMFAQLSLPLPDWLAGFFQSLGAIIFLPHVIPGLGLAIILLFSSRILFILAVSGYYAGTLITALMVGSFPQAFSHIHNFNYILIAMAVGGIFLIPSPRSYAMALIGVAMSSILMDSVLVFWSAFGIPVFTVPFNVISLSFLYVLGLVSFPLLAQYLKSTPEETLDDYLATVRRYKGTTRTLSLPFSGRWTVWQAFDGQWTHQGHWKYAYDFVLTTDAPDQNPPKTHRNDGSQLPDYFSFNKPVLAPVRGRVVKVIAHLPDNPIGQVDKINNWGNLIIIQDYRGFFVEISHFAQNSIRVKEGDWVERQTLLGLCGNSGYSPQPHIHVQVQGTGEIGSYTLPFSFVSYLTKTPTGGDFFHANDLPAEDATAEPVFRDKSLEIKTSFMLDDVYRYEIWQDGRRNGELSLTVRMALDGTFYFDSGRGQLYFGIYEDTFYMYRLDGQDACLKALFMALPRLPLTGKVGLVWRDYLPVGLAARGLNKAGLQFLSSFYHDIAIVEAELTCAKPDVIEGTIRSTALNLNRRTCVELDEQVGFKTIRVDGLELRRMTGNVR